MTSVIIYWVRDVMGILFVSLVSSWYSACAFLVICSQIFINAVDIDGLNDD